jgi:Tol biopolymer transport system component
VVFQSDREGDFGMFSQLADGSGAAERLTKPEKGVAHVPDSWSPDGQTISFTEKKSDGDTVWTYSLRDKKATLFAAASGLLLGGSVFSPDGRWIAYQESNRPESRREISSIIGRVYVQPFPPGAAPYQAPQDADTHHPLWSPDGKELFYSAGPSLFGSMSVTTRPSVSFGSPARLGRALTRQLPAPPGRTTSFPTASISSEWCLRRKRSPAAQRKSKWFSTGSRT